MQHTVEQINHKSETYIDITRNLHNKIQTVSPDNFCLQMFKQQIVYCIFPNKCLLANTDDPPSLFFCARENTLEKNGQQRPKLYLC